MSKLHKTFICYIYIVCIVYALHQEPEINPYENTTQVEEIKLLKENKETELEVDTESLIKRICRMISQPMIQIISIPKVRSVLTNIGICVVNGAMELITFYLPTPLIPLIAKAAGMIIPFGPVVMLREKIPVTSYRSAFRTALGSFLGTFDRYKFDDEDDDPYMTRRFNRRFISDSEKKKQLVML